MRVLGEYGVLTMEEPCRSELGRLLYGLRNHSEEQELYITFTTSMHSDWRCGVYCMRNKFSIGGQIALGLKSVPSLIED